MVLLGLGVCQGFRKQLHTSPYVLENEVEENTKASARAFTPRDFTPPQYFLLGFKDRDLEDEYLDDLCRISKNQIILGYSMCLLLVILGWFISYWLVLNVGYEIILGDLFNLKYTFFVENLVCHVIALLLFIGGLLGCVLVYRMDRFRAKRAVLHVTETVFLLFTVVMAYDFSRGKFPIMGERPSGWAINLAFYYLPPFVIFFFKSMPFAQTLEIITLAILTFIVIVPLASGYFGSDRVGEYIERRKDLSNARVCKEFYNLCAFDFTISLVWPVCVIVLMGVQICIVSFFVDRTNRRAFVNKRLVEVQQIKLNHSNKQKERMLKRQKKDQEDLIYSIFPKVIAKDLIAKQARKNQMEEVSATLAVSKSPTFKKTLEDVKSDAIGSLGRTVARMHPDVTILFTDIVGFTSMSQTCRPYEVMNFLHTLFVQFDQLVDQDSNLWKVETIGDAFMVASGLEMALEEEDEEDEEGQYDFSDSLGKSLNRLTSFKHDYDPITSG